MSASRFKVPVSADEVVIVPGGKVTFYFACLLFGGPGAEILYPDPGFPPYREAIRSGGAKGVPYPIREEKDFGFDAEEVLSLITPRDAPHHDQFAGQSDRRRRRSRARSRSWPRVLPGIPMSRCCRTRSTATSFSRAPSSRAS